VIPYTGFAFDLPDGTKRKITAFTPGSPVVWSGYTWNMVVATVPTDLGGGIRAQSIIPASGSITVYYSFIYNGSGYNLMTGTITISTTQDSPSPIPSTSNPSGFAPSISHSPETQAEIDKLIFGNPPGVVIAKPAPFIAGQLATAQAQAVAKVVEATAVAAEAVAAVNPTDTVLQTAAAQARAVADQAEIAAQGEIAEFEATEVEKATEAEKAGEEEAESDIPYNPSGLGDPYTLPEVDFGERLRQFINTCKSSSIFSLPSAVLGNVPAAGTSTMTIQGGQIFGTHVFDFADLSSMWNVLRGIILTGFSFIAVRVVTLKK